MNKKILSLAIPFFLANISVPLLGLVDTAVLGHMESERYLGAIALGGMIFNFIFWGFSFLKMGTTGFTAQANGRQDKKEISMVLFRGLFIGISIGLLLILLKSQVWWIASVFLEGSDDVIALAGEYVRIRIWSAPAAFMLYVITGWFLGMQNAMYVLYITITENVLNIGFNLLFVYGFDMRADGVALGTVCAQYLALMLAFSLLYFRYYQQIHKHKFIAIVKLMELFHYFKVNADIMIRTLALMFAFAFFTVKSSSYNDVLLASNMILMQCMIFFAYVIDGLAHAGESLSGYFYGAGKNKALRLLIRRVFLWSLGLAVIFSLVYFIFFENILELLTNRPNVIETAYRFRFWLAAIPLLSFAAFVWDGIYIGLTATSYLRNAMLLSLLVIYLPVFYIVSAFADEHALWIAMSAFMLARGGFLWFFSSKLPPFQKQPVLFI